jgi:YD repeat-containing protein
VAAAADPATPVITAGGPTTFCAGGSVTLTAPAGFTYTWSTGLLQSIEDPFGNRTTFLYDATGNRTVVQDNFGGFLTSTSNSYMQVVTSSGAPARTCVRASAFRQIDLDGRIALLSMAGSRRYLIIELACGRSELVQMATLGHELFHAIEIAEEPSAVNAETVADLYAPVGGAMRRKIHATGDQRGARRFTSTKAVYAGTHGRKCVCGYVAATTSKYG